MDNIFTLIIFNVVLILILLNPGNGKSIQLGGVEEEISDFVNKNKDWCDDNMDKMKKWINAHSMCKMINKNEEENTDELIKREQKNETNLDM